MLTLKEAETLSDDVLLSRLQGALRDSRVLLADLLALLGEVDARRLYLQRAYASSFAYCVGELGFSEAEAYERIFVARLCRRLPLVLEAPRQGRVHLTAARLLAPHLTEANCQALLAEAQGLTRRDVEEMVARLAPVPPAPESIRRLPRQKEKSETREDATSALAVRPAAPGTPSEAVAVLPAVEPLVLIPPPPKRLSHPASTPLSEDTFKVQFTAPRSLRDKLQEANALLGADVATVLEKALDLLLSDVKKRRFALVPSPKKAPLPTLRGAERHIPAAIRRAVYQRDEGRCTFQSDDGHRCNETRNLEFDHIQGFARMREHTVDGIRLLCRAHNQFEADRLYGPWSRPQANLV